MHRIDDATRLVDANGTGKDGFTEGDVLTQVPATVVTAAWANALQEEVAGIVESTGAALVKADNTQLLTAITNMMNRKADMLQATTLAQKFNVASPSGAASNGYNVICVCRIGAPDQIYTSTDGGETFASHAFGGPTTHGARALTYDTYHSQFICVGTGGDIQTSPDGTTWTHRTADASYASTFRDVAWSGYYTSLAVAVGTNGEIQTSPDGTTWTHRAAASSYTGTFLSVAWSDALRLWAAVGANGEIQTSPDGTTWTRRFSNNAVTFLRVSAAPNGFIATTSSYQYRSSDGITWSEAVGLSGDRPYQSGLVASFSSTALYFAAAGALYFAANIGATITDVIRTSTAWVLFTSGGDVYVSKALPHSLVT